MSEDRYKYIFSDQNKNNNYKKYIKNIEKCYMKAGIEIKEISGGRDKKTKQYQILVWPDSDDNLEALKYSFKYLYSLPSDERPYAELHLDQTNDEYYYVQEGKEVFGVDNIDDLTRLLKVGKMSPERTFYDLVKGKNNFLLKLSFAKKPHVSELYSTTKDLIKIKSEENVNKVAQSITEMLERAEREGWEVHAFPNGYDEDEDENITGDIALLNNIVFSEIEGKNLFLGFKLPDDFHMKACSEEDCSFCGYYYNTDCAKTKTFLALVECLFIANFCSGIKGKYQPGVAGGTKIFTYLQSLNDGFLQYGPCGQFPSQIWPS